MPQTISRKSLTHLQFFLFKLQAKNKIDIYWLWPLKSKTWVERLYSQCNSFIQQTLITDYAPCWRLMRIYFFIQQLFTVLCTGYPPFVYPTYSPRPHTHIYTDPFFSLLCPVLSPKRRTSASSGPLACSLVWSMRGTRGHLKVKRSKMWWCLLPAPSYMLPTSELDLWLHDYTFAKWPTVLHFPLSLVLVTLFPSLVSSATEVIMTFHFFWFPSASAPLVNFCNPVLTSVRSSFVEYSSCKPSKVSTADCPQRPPESPVDQRKLSLLFTIIRKSITLVRS